MWGTNSRLFFKQALSFTKVKILYSRITFTRVITLYFGFTVITCIILSALQGVTFRDNSQAISTIGTVIGSSRVDGGFVVLEKSTLRLCDSIPDQRGTNCSDILTFGSNNLQSRSVSDVPAQPETPATDEMNEKLDIIASRSADDDSDSEDNDADESNDDEDESDDDETEVGKSTVDETAISPSALDDSSTDAQATSTSALDNTCILSLRWLDDTIHDAQREDIVTFVFQLWLFVLALVTILNESIPHLIAGLLGHVLGTAWSGYRIHSTSSLKSLYQNNIVPEACNGHDLMGNWWDIRIQHAIPVVVMNAIFLIVLCGLSYKLFSVYPNESFSRVGASAKIHRIYKIVLLFSVSLQLSGFFTIASTGMWIDKICHGSMMEFAHNSKIYMAAFILTLVFSFPWFYLGWVCVRKEFKIRFIFFVGISVFLLTISTVMFTSPLYVYIFLSWRLFGVMSVTAYVLAVATTILAILCRLNFGKGLAHYLQVSDALEGMDFTPVVFSKADDSDLEKYGAADTKFGPATFMAPDTVHIPPTAFNLSKPNKQRGSSIYSEQNGTAVYLSSSPPLVSELTPAPKRLSRAACKRSVRIPYPTLKDIDGVKAEARKSKVLAVLRITSERGSVGSGLALPTRSRSVSSTASLDGAPKKVGLPANPRSSKRPNRLL